MRPLLAGAAGVLVVGADTALQAAAHPGLPPWAVLAHAVVAALLVAARRAPLAALAVTTALSALTGGAFVLLMFTAYHAGRAASSRRATAVLAGIAAGGLGLQVLTASGPAPQAVAGYLVLLVLPLLVGRYLAQHRSLVSALDRQNQYLRRERALLAEREQLRERLRIARDVHDSLGRGLSLVAVQAAALEVAGLPPDQRAAVRAVGDTARDTMTELYQLVGSLRGTHEDGRGVAEVGEVVARSLAAGQEVTLAVTGEPRPLPVALDTAAYRLVEEGLTNAAKHAPGRPVAIHLTWEADALVLTVVNPVDPGGVSGAAPAGGAGYGLAGLRERVAAAGGYLDHRAGDGEFRLVAMLPLPVPEEQGPDRPIGRVRVAALGVATAVMLLVLLPASLLTGVS